MELSLSLGRPVDELARTMSEHELARWIAWKKKKLLPFERMEWYLAHLAMLVVKVQGGNDQVRLADFFYRSDVTATEMTPEEQLEAAKEAFDVKPVRRRKKHHGR